ncbi:MAG: FeS assembly SUF system protein [Chloroflexi bacterium]|nr:MAG: FeS assembly SUF system protein [Chloroflexota bacterium]
METTQAPASGDLRQQIDAQLATCKDPEIGLDIMSLGLVYDLFDEVKAKVEEIPAVRSCTVELVYSPPWSADMMSDDAKMELGFL